MLFLITFLILIIGEVLIVLHFRRRIRTMTDQQIQVAHLILGAFIGNFFWIFHPGSSWFPWRHTWEYWKHGFVVIVVSGIVSAIGGLLLGKYADAMGVPDPEEEFWNSFPPGTYQKWGKLIEDTSIQHSPDTIGVCSECGTPIAENHGTKDRPMCKGCSIERKED